MPKSILRNAPSNDSSEPPEETSPHNEGEYQEIDRNQVLENTRANAQLHNVGAAIKEQTNSPQLEHSGQNGAGSAGLKWDEVNIYKNEQDKTTKMKIDEPKTPYQGAVGESEYYLPDEEEEAVKTRDDKRLNVDELDEFSLGEAQYGNTADPTVQNDRIEKVDMGDSNDEQESLTAEERHRRFEEKRKAHYHMKGNVLKHPIPPEPEDEE